MGDSVLAVDKINHQVASRIVGAFTTFKNFDKQRQVRGQAPTRSVQACCVDGMAGRCCASL